MITIRLLPFSQSNVTICFYCPSLSNDVGSESKRPDVDATEYVFSDPVTRNKNTSSPVNPLCIVHRISVNRYGTNNNTSTYVHTNSTYSVKTARRRVFLSTLRHAAGGASSASADGSTRLAQLAGNTYCTVLAGPGRPAGPSGD